MTRDIAVFPDGAADDNFLWRASIATIDAAGPFSTFPGVDRQLLPLEGELSLTIAGLGERRLLPGDPATAFPGEAAVTAAPIGGAATVLNIMVRRGIMRARLEHLASAPPTSAERILLLAIEKTGIRRDGETVDLEMHDALLLETEDLIALEINRPVIAALFFNAR